MSAATRLAISLVFVGVLAILSRYLSHPYHRTMAWLWGVRSVLAIAGMVGWNHTWMSDGPQLLIAVGTGAALAVSTVLCLHSAHRAADISVGLTVREWLAVLCAGGAIGFLGYQWATTLAMESLLATLMWGRILRIAGYCAALVLTVRLWRRRPWFASRLTPLLTAFASAVVCFVADAGLRLSHPGGDSLAVELQSSVILTCGVVVFGIGGIWTALQIERELMVTRAAADQQAVATRAESQRLEHLGSMATGVAHDVNNMLTIVRTIAEGVRQDLPGSDVEALRNLQHAVDAAEDAGTWSQRLMRFARSRGSTPTPVTVAPFMESLLPMLQRIAPGQAVVSLHHTPTPPVLVDSARLEQVMFNLVLNAIESADAIGDIRISVSHVHPVAPRACSMGWLQPGPYVCLSVDDQGPGIPAARLPRLFDPFFTTKGAEHAGLGLYTVARFALEYQGAVDVVTQEGAGTAVHLYLPCDAATVAARRPLGVRRLMSVPRVAPPELADWSGVLVRRVSST